MNNTFDEALQLLRGTGSEVAGGVAPNHGPMAAEALVVLGRDDTVVAWAERYRRKLNAMPSSRSPITTEDWAEALGVIDRFPDWVGFFRAKLAETSWRAVFREWIGRLLPAYQGVGRHVFMMFPFCQATKNRIQGQSDRSNRMIWVFC